MNLENLKQNLLHAHAAYKKQSLQTPKVSNYTTHITAHKTSTAPDRCLYITPYLKYYTETKEGTLTLYLITPENKIVVDGFSCDIKQIKLFEPKSNLFKEIDRCLLIILKNQVIIYGLERKEDRYILINTGMSVIIDGEIQHVAVNNDGFVVFSAGDTLYQLFYAHGFFRTTYAKKLKNLTNYIYSLFKGTEGVIRDITLSDKYLVALYETSVEIYSLRNGKLKIHRKMENISCVKVAFFTDSMFVAIDCDGNRRFIDDKGVLSIVGSPQDLTYYSSSAVIASNGQTTVIAKRKLDLNETLIIVITQNEYLMNSEREINDCYKENFQSFVVQEEVLEILIFMRTIILRTERGFLFYNLLTAQEYLLTLKTEEIGKTTALFGEQLFLYNFLCLIESESDTRKIEFVFLRNSCYSFIYRYLLDKIIDSGVEGFEKVHLGYYCLRTDEDKPNCTVMAAERLRMNIERMKTVYKRLTKYRKSDLQAVLSHFKTVLDALRFLLIVKDMKPDVDFTGLLYNMEYRKDILYHLSKTISFEKTSKLIESTLKDFFPIEEIYFRKGLNLVSKKRKDLYYLSIEDFKHSGNPEEGIKIYNENKFYVGSVSLIRDSFFSKTEVNTKKRIKIDGNIDISRNKQDSFSVYEKITDYLSESLRCKGALKKALEDYREEFVFQVMDAYLQNLLINRRFVEDCACCTLESDSKVYHNTAIDLIYIENIYLEKFLTSKYEISLNREEFDLLWKYYIVKKDRKRSGEILVEIAKNKPLLLETRIEYLYRSYCIDKKEDTRLLLETAKIQHELCSKKPEFYYIKGLLLGSSELFNEYLYTGDEYLALRIIKLYGNKDEAAKKELVINLLKGTYIQIIEKIGYFKDLNEDSWIDIEIVGDLLIKELRDDSSINLVTTLLSFNYTEEEARKYVVDRIKGTVFMHPEIKRRLMNELREYFGGGSYFSEVKSYCLTHFGVRI